MRHGKRRQEEEKLGGLGGSGGINLGGFGGKTQGSLWEQTWRVSEIQL